MKFRFFSEGTLSPCQGFPVQFRHPGNSGNKVILVLWPKWYFQSHTLIYNFATPPPRSDVYFTFPQTWAFVMLWDRMWPKWCYMTLEPRSVKMIKLLPSSCFEDSHSWSQPLCWRTPGHTRRPWIGIPADGNHWLTDTWTNDTSDNYSLPAPDPRIPLCSLQQRQTSLVVLCPSSWATESMGIINGCFVH